ncbi:MAG: DUF411 domain-containing protein [Polaromonas sp.]
MSPPVNHTRRALFGLTAVAAVVGLGALPHWLAAAPRTQVTVWKTPNCGCCKEWVKHLEANGFEVVTHDVKETASKREALGLPAKYGSCHTATVNGYVLEGHVPAKDVQRLLREKPAAIGLAVPGMPVGSPGMEMEGATDAYDVVLVLKDGSARVFQSYPAKAAPAAKAA